MYEPVNARTQRAAVSAGSSAPTDGFAPRREGRRRSVATTVVPMGRFAPASAAAAELMHVLVMIHDPDRNDAMVAALHRAGIEVDQLSDLSAARVVMEHVGYSCLLIDRDLPNQDVLGFVDAYRSEDRRTPILVLGNESDLADRLRSFDVGADDYVERSSAVEEIVVRAIALGRRRDLVRPPRQHVGSVVLDRSRRRVERDGVPVDLSAKEYAVFEHIVAANSRVVSREELLEYCWQENAFPRSNVVDAKIRQLRRKLCDPGLIISVWGRGYRLGTAHSLD